MDTKLNGYILLIVGVAVMIFATAYIIMVFTNVMKPLPIFSMNDQANSLDINHIISQTQSDQLQSMPKNLNSTAMPKLDLISPKALNDILNLTTTFFLMSFLMGFGYKIANLGVMMIRPIYVKLKTQNVEAVNGEKQTA